MIKICFYRDEDQAAARMAEVVQTLGVSMSLYSNGKVYAFAFREDVCELLISFGMVEVARMEVPDETL